MDVEVEIMEMKPFRVIVTLAGRVLPAQRRRQPRPAAGPEARERWALAGLASGELDAAGYRTAMAELAATGDRQADDAAALVWCAGRGSRAAEELERLVCRLVTRLPELSVSTVRTAVVLNRYGARSDELIRLLRLSRLQARTIICGIETR